MFPAINGAHEYEYACTEKKIEKHEAYTLVRLDLEGATYLTAGNASSEANVS
jgi:hypothetical protein